MCSGIEAASVAWSPLGWEAAWFAEIEPFPSAVLAHHYPHVPNLGDMTTVARRVISGEVDAPDLLCGGTPCQAFSVAGLRKSLDDDRGNLTLKFVELADAIDHVRARAGLDPADVFWENVPGVLSTKDNAFGCFLAGLAGEDEPLVSPRPPDAQGRRTWSNAGCVYGPKRAIAWRTLDAQYFGLAQRRRRVFVVASARNGFDPATVLFEWDGVRRDTAPSREAGQNAAAGTLRSTDGGCDVDHVRAGHVVGPLTAACGPNGHGGSGYKGDFESETFLVQETTHTLRGEGFDASEDGTGRGTPLVPVAFPANLSGTQHASAENLAPSMGAKNPTAVAFQSSQSGVRIGDTHATLDANNGPRRHNGALIGMQVRRLTPTECERLQGFPDDYTAIPWRNKPASECPDGPRYKALGNSWATHVVSWLGRRLAKAKGLEVAA